MGNGSPTAYLLWAILSCIYLVFLLMHLWNYDRFQCLRWDSGRQPGAFKRVMTYSYLGTVPLLVVFSVAITVLKFKEGFILAPDGRIVPIPFSFWRPANKVWVLPLNFILSIAWSLEHVTHLEELTFWVFLLNQGPGKREWFASWEFRVWTIGSFATLTAMPMTVLATRHNIDTCLAYVFLVGSAAGTTTTVCFLYVLARFPWFIRHVRKEGAEPDVVVRLATFYQLNRIRVVFRYLFTVPLMIIALDGLASPYPIIGDPFAMDFLLMMGGIGCFISSAITLLIFFPRSITRESGYHPKAHSASPHHTASSKTKMQLHPIGQGQVLQYHTSSSTTRQEHAPSHKSTIIVRPGEPRLGTGAFRFPDAGSAEGTGEGDLMSREGDAYSYPYSHSYSFDLVRSASSASGHQLGRERGRERVDSNVSVSELSPGYMSDAESTSETPWVAPGQGQEHGQGVSSDDTVWERGGGGGAYGFRYRREGGYEYGAGPGAEVGNGDRTNGRKRRRHSDGPFFFDARGQLVSAAAGGQPLAGAGAGAGMGNGKGRGREEREDAVEESTLHPYVLHFTSPIDLHDGGRLSRSERGGVRWPAV
ncbi:hypothetical protein LshimejAT787_0409600 [Lyophyllum shimeji]|uniref:Transmembrane protein n=1 Tax=Lyophyllum shimeji TaxID=47721 RepID=A0A9P3PLZ4_LYOSH|nr:hypothetical protein LshimejAT787_0409600 [Lyophyllum shimeji]